ncbi:MAG TPA: hypothetical protein VMY77_13190 [Chitinophagaceae bacterium]|nr:hypothetical protein [Chitinophagaceae bacterium]
MTDLSLNKDMNLTVTARFIGKGHESALTDAYTVRLYDKDVFGDDFLGETRLDDKGVAKFSFTHNAFSDALSLDEKPDFYFVVYKHKQEVFKTKVLEDLDIDTIDNLKMGEGEVIDLGTFLVDG